MERENMCRTVVAPSLGRVGECGNHGVVKVGPHWVCSVHAPAPARPAPDPSPPNPSGALPQVKEVIERHVALLERTLAEKWTSFSDLLSASRTHLLGAMRVIDTLAAQRDDWRRRHAECTTSLITADRRVAQLEAELDAARAAVGEAWLRGGATLAEAIGRKTRKLEELADASDLEDVERDAMEALVAWIPSLYDAVGHDHLAATSRLADAGDRLIKARKRRRTAVVSLSPEASARVR